MRFYFNLSICLMIASSNMMMFAMQGASSGYRTQADYELPGAEGQYLSAHDRTILASVWQYAKENGVEKKQYEVDARASAIIVGGLSSFLSFFVSLAVTNSLFGEYLNGWGRLGASCVLSYAAYKIASKAMYRLTYPPAPNGRVGQLFQARDQIVQEARAAASLSTRPGSMLGRLWTSPSQTAKIVAETSKNWWPLGALIRDPQFPAAQIFAQPIQQSSARSSSSRSGRVSQRDALDINMNVRIGGVEVRPDSVSPTITDEFMDMLYDIEGKRQPTRWQRLKASCGRWLLMQIPIGLVVLFKLAMLALKQ